MNSGDIHDKKQLDDEDCNCLYKEVNAVLNDASIPLITRQYIYSHIILKLTGNDILNKFDNAINKCSQQQKTAGLVKISFPE